MSMACMPKGFRPIDNKPVPFLHGQGPSLSPVRYAAEIMGASVWMKREKGVFCVSWSYERVSCT